MDPGLDPARAITIIRKAGVPQFLGMRVYSCRSFEPFIDRRFWAAEARAFKRRCRSMDFSDSSEINDQFQLSHDIRSALDNHSVRCFANTGIYFSITEV